MLRCQPKVFYSALSSTRNKKMKLIGLPDAYLSLVKD